PAPPRSLVFVRVVALEGRFRGAGELSLQRVEVGGVSAVLQLTSHFLLLCLSTAAPHGSTPSLPRLSGLRLRQSPGKLSSRDISLPRRSRRVHATAFGGRLGLPPSS